MQERKKGACSLEAATMDRVDGVWDSWLGGWKVGTKQGHLMGMV